MHERRFASASSSDGAESADDTATEVRATDDIVATLTPADRAALRDRLTQAGRLSMAGIKPGNRTKRVYSRVTVTPLASLSAQHASGLRLLDELTGGSAHEAGFRYTLVFDDNKVLYTPGGRLWAVPSEALATAAAMEWDAQDSTVKVNSMPLTQLSTTVVDLYASPDERAKKIETMMDYLPSDSVCFRVSSPPALVKLQEKHWDPLLAFMKKEFQCTMPISSVWTGEDAKYDEAGMRRVRAFLEGLDPWSLCVAEVVGGVCKSVSMGIALMRGARTAEQLAAACRVEENFQISQWGFVYGSHDLDIAYVKAHLYGAQTFWGLLQYPADRDTYLVTPSPVQNTSSAPTKTTL